MPLDFLTAETRGNLRETVLIIREGKRLTQAAAKSGKGSSAFEPVMQTNLNSERDAWLAYCARMIAEIATETLP